ncbi:complement C4-B [Trichonephila clavipes]|nr:complement C4-B [Trichonephila clavipes]
MGSLEGGALKQWCRLRYLIMVRNYDAHHQWALVYFRIHIRIIPLNEDALPSDKPIKLQIKNPNGTTVEETHFTKGKSSKFQTAFARHMFKFPNFPLKGEWTATVNYGYGFEQSTTVHFELLEYVLPTFTVELKTPEIILESDKDIVLTVKARYVYGEKVQGTVTYRLGVKGEAPQVTYFAIVGPKKLRDGFYEQVVSTNEFAHQEDIGWFPEIEGSHLVVEATVMEDATGNKEVAKDAKGRFSKTPFVVSFKRCLQDFKPGLMSIFEADINYINGKPAARIPTRISATADGQPLEITVPTSISNDEGKVSFEIHPEMHHNTISIKLETEDPRYVGQQATGHFIQHRFQSANKAFVALERSSAHRTKRYRTLNCNKTTMYYSIDMNFFYSKDNLVALHFKYDFWHRTATVGSDVVQSGRPIFDDFFQHLWPYIGNNTVNVVFQMVKRLWLIRIDQ